VRVLVGEDGSVKSVRVVRGLPVGLTEEALIVARANQVQTAMKDGKPVPYWVGLEISFNHPLMDHPSAKVMTKTVLLVVCCVCSPSLSALNASREVQTMFAKEINDR
jgi:hypothetical protein